MFAFFYRFPLLPVVQVILTGRRMGVIPFRAMCCLFRQLSLAQF